MDQTKRKERNSFVAETTEAVKKILEEQASVFSILADGEDVSDKELGLLRFSATEDAEDAASDIVRLVVEELGPDEADGASEDESETDARRESCCRKVEAFLVRRFSKEVVFKLVSGLGCRLKCFPTPEESWKLLLQEVSALVEDMIATKDHLKHGDATEEDDLCLYGRIARNISNGLNAVTAEELIDAIHHHLIQLTINRSKGLFMDEIQTEVDRFMEFMWRWLDHEARHRKRKTDLASDVMRQIEGVLPALTERPAEMDGDNLTCDRLKAVTEDPAATGDGAEAAPEEKCRTEQNWDKLCCLNHVTALVDQILKNTTPFKISCDHIRAINALKQMLWDEMTGCDVAVKLGVRHTKKTAKAVHEELCMTMGSAAAVQRHLLSRFMFSHVLIIRTLKKHLVTPENNSGFNGFFRAFCKRAAKTFSARKQ